MRLVKTSWIGLLAFVLAGAAQAASLDGLRKAWADPAASRSTFFIGGMSCRACTMMLDRNLSRTPGVLWARFNYPLRLLTVYHDPRKTAAEAIVASIGASGELRAVHLETRPARNARPAVKDSLASWKGGSVAAAAAPAILKPFEPTLREQLGDSPERAQVIYEILGEAVRNRILAALAKKEGYAKGGSPPPLPDVVAKDFYWPEKLLPLTPDEAAIARFLSAGVLKAGGNERKDFEAWLLGLWRSIGFDFRGEVAER
jgi:copper chaperone CopZ